MFHLLYFFILASQSQRRIRTKTTIKHLSIALSIWPVLYDLYKYETTRYSYSTW
jgi:hypothetical protein